MNPTSGLEEVDVLVVGAGPAGCAAAATLARAGHPTALVDRAHFPRPKPCGECLNPGAVATLERLGFLDAVRARHPAVLGGWRIRWPEESRDSQGRNGRGLREGGLGGRLPHPGGLALPRRDLDQALLDAARAAGARVFEGLTLEDLHPGTSPRDHRDQAEGRLPELSVRDAQGRRTSLRPRFVVAADGLRSRSARALGVIRHRPGGSKVSATFRLEGEPVSDDAPHQRPDRMGLPFFGQLYLAEEGTLGLAPLDAAGASWNATLVVDPRQWGRRLGRAPRETIEAWLAVAPLPWNRPLQVVEGPWGSGPFDQPVTAVTQGRVLLAGDAAGYYDPLTGQGIYRALHSGELAGAALDRALRRPREAAAALSAYQRALIRNVAPGRRVQRALETVLRRPRLRRGLLNALAKGGGRLDPLIAVTGDAAPARSLFHPLSLRVLAGWSRPQNLFD